MVNKRISHASEGPIWPLARLRTIGVALLLGVALAVSACAGFSTTRPTATATPAGPTSTATPGSQLTMKQAWGNVPIASLPTSVGDNLMFVWEFVATPDEQWLLGAVQQYDITKPRTNIPYLALYNIHTHQLQHIHDLLTLHSQVLGATVDDHWIAWSEADDASYFDWTLFLYNRATGQTTEVAAAPKVNGQAVSGPNTSPVISGGHMIWSQPIGEVTHGDISTLHNAVVKIEDLATGEITTLATGAGMSELSWPWASWGLLPTTAGGGISMEVKNLQTGQDIRLPVQPTTFALDGTSAAYDDDHSGYLINNFTDSKTSGGIVNPQVLVTSHDIEWITLNDRLVAWKQDTTQPIVWDRLFNRPVVLPEQNTADSTVAWIAGNLLVWWQSQNVEQQIPPVLQIVDTATLPTSPVSPA